jgi:tetratricopeptide (TPR) repeat protein
MREEWQETRGQNRRDVRAGLAGLNLPGLNELLMVQQAKDISGMIAEADLLYRGRVDIAGVRRTVALLRVAALEEFEAAWRLGRAHFFLGQEDHTLEGRETHYRSGVEASARATYLNPNRVEGHFWLGVNLALLASEKNFWSAASLALKARRSLRQAIELDRSYHGGGPLRVLARLEHRLPALLGGGKARARRRFEEAIQTDPTNTVTRIYFAELLLDLSEQSLATEQFEHVLSATEDAAWEFEIERDKRIARSTLGV